MTTITKRCARCDLELSLGAFHRDRTRVDGLATACKTCRKELAAERYQRNRAKVLAGCREYYLDHTAAVLERNARYAAEHPEVMRAATRNYRARLTADQWKQINAKRRERYAAKQKGNES